MTIIYHLQRLLCASDLLRRRHGCPEIQGLLIYFLLTFLLEGSSWIHPSSTGVPLDLNLVTSRVLPRPITGMLSFSVQVPQAHLCCSFIHQCHHDLMVSTFQCNTLLDVPCNPCFLCICCTNICREAVIRTRIRRLVESPLKK